MLPPVYDPPPPHRPVPELPNPSITPAPAPAPARPRPPVPLTEEDAAGAARPVRIHEAAARRGAGSGAGPAGQHRAAPPRPGLGVAKLKGATAPSRWHQPSGEKTQGTHRARRPKDIERAIGGGGGHRAPRQGHNGEGPAHLYPFKRGRRQKQHDLTRGTAVQKPVNREGKMLPQNSIARSRGPDKPLKAEREAAWSVLQGCIKPNPTNDELTPFLSQKLALLPPQRRPPPATVCSAPAGVSSRKAGLKRFEKLNLAPEKGHRWFSDGYTSTSICCCSSCAPHAAIWLYLRDPCAEE